jgi:hypothetical protein
LLIYYIECPGPKDSCLLWANYTDSESSGSDEEGGVGPVVQLGSNEEVEEVEEDDEE